MHVPVADIDKALEQSLAEVIDGLAIDRGAIVEDDGTRPAARIIWTSPAVTRPPPAVLDPARFPWTAARVRSGDGVRFSCPEDLPPAAASDRASFEAAGTRSHLSLPLRAAGRPLGVLSLETVHTARAWSEELVESLRLLGEAFVNALERRRMDAALVRRLEFEQMVASLSTTLSAVSAADFDREIERALRRIVDVLDAGRGTMMELARDGSIRRAWTTDNGPDDAGWATTLPLTVGGTVVGRLALGPIRVEAPPSLELLAEVFANTLARQQRDQETQRLRQELAHIGRVSAMGELTASLAHELNQPLTAILNNAQVAQRLLTADVVDVAELGEILRDIVADDRRAADVIQRLRRLVKKGDLEYASLDVNEIVTDVARLVTTDAAARDIALRVDLASGLPRVSGDRVQLLQVVLNLVLNGLDATCAAGAGDRALVVRTFGDVGSGVGVAVQDAGGGIAARDADHIFEPLYTTKADGLGMGLAIARTIVDAHGGLLAAENNREGGATFRFTIPAQPVVAS